jgi:hypothetical protein
MIVLHAVERLRSTAQLLVEAEFRHQLLALFAALTRRVLDQLAQPFTAGAVGAQSAPERVGMNR